MRLHPTSRTAFAFACAIVLALAFAMPASAAKCDIKGTAKGETIVGTDKAEVICGMGGNDVIYGKGGDDTIHGGSGNDTVQGGPGDDRLIGGKGADDVRGGSGSDRLSGGPGDDRLFGGTGNDTLDAGTGADDVRGGAGNDRLRGGAGNDRLLGGHGNDTLSGSSDDDEAYGGNGDDTVHGDTGQDKVYGGNGSDRLYGDSGSDRLYGGNGSDYLDGGRDGDRLSGGDGNDEIRGNTGDDVLYGRAGADTLHGGAGNDTVSGEAGNDTLRGSSGNDELYGGDGRDQMYGGLGSDRLVGGAGQDRMYGLQGNDRLISEDGMKDVVRGGKGRDGCNEDRKDDLKGVEYRIGGGSIGTDRGSGGTVTIVQPSEPVTTGIVSTVTRAPVVADGDVAGAPTDIVIGLDTSLHPAVAGQTLQAGGTLRVTLPDAFSSSGLPTSGPATCDPMSGACNTGVLLQVADGTGAVPYTVEMVDRHTIVFTALDDIGPGEMPGIKQIHLALPGFTNPKPGTYAIEVEAETGPGGSVETGTAALTVRSSIEPSINATNLFVEPGEGRPPTDVAYQRTTIETAAPYAWDFLLWERSGAPAAGVELRQGDHRGGDIIQNGQLIGCYKTEAPAGARGQSVSGGPSVVSQVPGSTDEAGRLTVAFTAGDIPGLYETTFSLDDGNSQEMHVEVS